MFEQQRKRRAVQRVKPGDGRALKRFRWWQPLSRALFHLLLTSDDGRQVVYSVDAHHGKRFLSDDAKGKVHLYLDGRHHAESGLPAVFPVHGGTIEVAATAFGLKRCHYVTTDGTEKQLTPDPSSAEGRRARLDREHPALSRAIGVFSTVLLLVSLVLLIPQLAEVVFDIPVVTEHLGTFTSPIRLPVWLNVSLTLATGTASMERALRLRFHWLLDAVG